MSIKYYKLKMVFWSVAVCGVMYNARMCGGLWSRLMSDGVPCELTTYSVVSCGDELQVVWSALQ